MEEIPSLRAEPGGYPVAVDRLAFHGRSRVAAIGKLEEAVVIQCCGEFDSGSGFRRGEPGSDPGDDLGGVNKVGVIAATDDEYVR